MRFCNDSIWRNSLNEWIQINEEGISVITEKVREWIKLNGDPANIRESFEKDFTT